ncbi:BON domain-containing protein [Aridibaculum aurantiacum]|uniref:BON domain-containing protein n=1 Tax=Aridibaculum aurantiacum TaxID=2810307 RepID=UPI001A957E2D|nr:BON domain-containing protein [Aridibaculum aurantiacum]
MNQFKHSSLLLWMIALLSFTLISCGGKVNDETLQQNVNEKIKADGGNQAINATVKDGVVTLSGTCRGENCAANIEKQIAAVEGVRSVDNQVQVDNSTDLTLRTSVHSVISKYQGVQADVAGGVVVLRGSIDRSQLQPLMNELQSLQPKQIDNQLAILQ